MDIFTERELKKLIDNQKGMCISMYMPSFRTGSEMQQGPIRLKNLIGEAEERLIVLGMRPTDASNLLERPRQLLEDTYFWQHQSDGLAIFLTENSFHIYSLPMSFPQLVVVGERFHLKPVVYLLSGNTTFYILDLRLAGVRLFSATRDTIAQIQSDQFPLSIDEVLRYDKPEKQVQFAKKPDTASGNPPTVFGYGRQTDKEKENILHYFETINRIICNLFQNTDAPLVLAGIDYYHPLYKQVNSYPYLVDKGITKGTDNMPNQELHDEAWKIVVPIFQDTQKHAIEYYRQLSGEKSPIATHDLETIISGARHGRIETLFVIDGNMHRWGKFDENEQHVELHEKEEPGDNDLLDLAAIDTLLKKGTVYILQPQNAPDTTPAAAILRF